MKLLQQTASLILSYPIQAVFISVPTLIVTYIVLNEFVRASLRIPGFSGPKGYPLLGNLLDIRSNAPERYRQWIRQFGDVYQIQLGNVPVLIVNSAKAAKEIFVKNSSATSSRPEFYTFHKVVSSTAGFTIGTSPASESLKRRRKSAATALNRPAVQSYVPHLDLETRDFVKDLYIRGKAGEKPVDPIPMVQRLSLNLSLTLNWGTRIGSIDDELFEEITEVEDFVSKFRSTTGNLQDYIPILRLNPFNKTTSTAREMRARRDVYLTNLNKDLDKRMASGKHTPCIQANIIQDPEASLDAAELMSISLTMVSGGLDTITTLLSWGIALLSERMDLQEMAFEAIRDHFGEGEVMGDPWEDQKCPYVVALVKECLRYYTVLRLALPRSTVKDINYEGKTIPSGTIIFLNAWACNMDPTLYPNPTTFDPTRFLSAPDTPIHTYGLGSRMCAGYLLGNRELYLIFIRMISCFRIVKSEDVDVDPVTGSVDPRSLVSTPRRYRVRFVPRGAEVGRALGVE
ncbi:hypothetical protein RUND412_009752 [Rhizina undulata]